MGLFNWLMKGMGFEGEDADQNNNASNSSEQKEKKRKRKKEEVAVDMETTDRNTYAANPDQFNTAGRYDMGATYLGQQNMGGYGTKNVMFVFPKNYNEVQKLVDYLKQGESAILNLDGISDDEAQRMLDFVSGAVYALNGSTQRVSGNIFLLTPEGLNIMVPTEGDKKE